MMCIFFKERSKVTWNNVKKISYLGFNILCIKISTHKFLNSLKYPYLLVK